MSDDILGLNEELLKDPAIREELLKEALKNIEEELGEEVSVESMSADELSQAMADRTTYNPYNETLVGIKQNREESQSKNDEWINQLRESYNLTGDISISLNPDGYADELYPRNEQEISEPIKSREVGVGDIFDFKRLPDDVITITDIDEYKSLPDGDYFDSSNRAFSRPEDALKSEYDYIKNVDAKGWLASTFTSQELARIKAHYRSTRKTQAYQEELAKDYFTISVFAPRENAELDRYLLEGNPVNKNTLYFMSNTDFDAIEKDIRNEIL